MTNRERQKKNLKRNAIRNIPGGDDDKFLRMSKKHNRIRLFVILGIILVIALLAVAAFLLNRYHKYSSFELKWEKELSEGSFVDYVRLGDNVIKFSHDGASCLDKNGDELWVDSYEMNAPQAYVAGDYACIYDAGGNAIRIYDSEGQCGAATTLMPITKAVVSEAGNCAAIVEDDDASYINFYKNDGTEQDISIKTRLEGDGYPVDIALSPDGTQLIAAFEYLDSGVMRSKVVFYDFSEIGKNIPNRLVGGFEEPFADSLVARVRFINSTYSYAVADTGIYIFSSKNLSSPELIAQIPTDDRINAIFNYKNHLGVVYEGEEGKYLRIYKDDGSVELEKKLDFDFDLVTADDTYIYFADSDHLVIMNQQGNVKYDGDMEEAMSTITHGKLPGEFIFSGSNYMRDYTFK